MFLLKIKMFSEFAYEISITLSRKPDNVTSD
jgi:hypothetical protein